MAQRVIVDDVGVDWEPNVEHGVLVVSETGDATLTLLACVDDPDQRHVVLTWRRVRAARMESPNDEARSGHPLYKFGLSDVRRVGEVLDSDLISDLERRNRVHDLHDARWFAGLRHWVVPLKGSTVEVVAESFEVVRPDPESP